MSTCLLKEPSPFCKNVFSVFWFWVRIQHKNIFNVWFLGHSYEKDVSSRPSQKKTWPWTPGFNTGNLIPSQLRTLTSILRACSAYV
jgi:hypothetical protein